MICVLLVEWEVSEVFRRHFGHRIPQNSAPNAAMGSSPRSKGQQRRRDGFGCSDDQGWDIQIQTNHLTSWRRGGDVTITQVSGARRAAPRHQWPGQAVGLGEKVLVMAVAHIQCEGGAYYGPHETRTFSIPSNAGEGFKL